ncbi:MAG: putative metal-binding motif-containing protein [Deltaproteobacteria bacterium]|nr:putative metal-binding motif-containing protein [Deltaproteobacteria bacterium]
MTSPRASVRAMAFAVAAAVALPLVHAGCGSDEPELFVKPADAGADGDASDERGPEVDPTLGGPCTEDSQCNDAIPCTFDRCDQTLSRCRNTPDDSLCADPFYCNGRERCVLRLGCQPGPVVTCQDDNPCTIDKCIEATKSCVHEDRDLDGDGDPDDHCIGKRDCNDIDPNVSSKRAEVCGNFVDDNCNGVIDEPGCVQPANDVCSNALAVSASGTYTLSTLATRKDYATSCTVKTPASAKDVVVAITVPGVATDPPKDVEVWPTTRAPAPNERNEVAVALQATCGQAATEIACGHTDPFGEPVAVVSTSARAIARGVTPGTTVYAVVTTQTEGIIDLEVDIRAAKPKPANETCAAPEAVALDTPFTVSLIDPAKDLASDCPTATGELTYAFTLPAERDVRIFGSTLTGSGVPVVTLRDATCTGELRCRKGVTPPAFARRLAAGTHVFTVAGTSALDASILVKTYPPTDPPPNQDCATAPPITPNTDVTVDLSAQEDAIKNGCFGGSLQAAYDLTLTQPSDVLVIGRFPSNESGAVSINQVGCTKADVLACSNKGPTPQRVSRRNLPAGTYRIGIADELGQTVKLSVLVRPTVAPTNVVGADTCTSAGTIPATGGFFLGDTTGATADFSAGCDAPGQPIGGAKDQIFKLDLGAKKRVVFDMIGTEFTPLLDVRRGPGCPGAEMESGCYVGFGPGRAFLDMLLDPGSYFVQVDGYNGDRGKWNLDVRVIDPP